MPRTASSSVRSLEAMVEKLLAEQAELRKELQHMREKMSDTEAARTTAKAAQSLSEAVQMERARMAEFWREADKGPKTTVILEEPVTLTIAGRVVALQAGKNTVPKAIVPFLETRLSDIASAKAVLNALQLKDESSPLPAEEVERILAGKG